MCLNISCFSNPGGRVANEDRTTFFTGEKGFLAAVADGLGGHGSGDKAAEAALEYLSFPLSSLQREPLQILIEEMNEHIMASCSGKTTLAMVACQDDTACTLHVGDSRIYQFRGNEIIFQTRDHSVSQLSAAVGEISPDEIRGHIDRNKLLRCLGSPDGAIPEIHSLQLQPGDGLLLCTDGFWEPILEQEMLHCFQNGSGSEAWLSAMTDLIASRLNEHSDNYTGLCLIYERSNT